MTAPRHLSHPGPRNPSRYTATPCLAHPVSLRLRAGMTFDQAVTAAFAEAGFDAGYVTLKDARFAHLAYVIPGKAPGDGRAAWYCSVPALDDATVSLAGLHLGQRSGTAVQHCHGLWSAADGRSRMGHMLLSDSTLADTTIAEGWGLQGAALHVLQDPETGFDLFAPVKTKTVEKPNAVLSTLRPNEDPHAVLEEIAAQAGIRTGVLAGVGSLVDTHFTAGTLESYATEMLIRSGQLDNGAAELSVASVGFDAVPRCGSLARGANRICITAEILMIGS
jgi:predicted DNA-binding protein with PD1-like motif